MRASRYAPRAARAAAAALLDYRFDRSSPIPQLSDDLARAIATRDELVLPPPGLLGPGNQALEGLAFLASLGRALGAATCFEIGTYNGATAWTLARNLSGATVHTLDLPAETAAALPFGETDASNRLAFAQPVYEALPLQHGEVVQHWGDSATFDFGSWASTIDLVYVDGAHSAAYVRSDTERAFSLVRDGGAIVWDDYWRRIAGVRSVLDTLPAERFRVPGTRLVVHLTPAARSRLVD